MKKRILAILASVGLAVGLSVAAAPAAQAYPTTIYYTADCPGNARYQQLVIQNPTSDIAIYVYGWDNFHPLRWLANVKGTTTPGHVAITYVPIQYVDTVHYEIHHDTANYNWFYHVDCFY